MAIDDPIVRQVKFAVAAGVLRPGALAPSVRELARDLAIGRLCNLQDGMFERVGGERPIYADVRVIAATHRD
ncbi:MAG: sigma 54-interacting transcriptional regulator [Pirellulales bacterium]|nr:sigma 54-interacting transcriptional regulator [Pirellulales bacterium]